MAFNLADYEDVATLNKWLISNYPNFRSDISVISADPDKGYILVQATLWRDSNDASPAVSNIAFGSRDTYIQNMRKFYCEDTATSALGRAIILLKGSDKTATKDDMRKVDDAPIKNIMAKVAIRRLLKWHSESHLQMMLSQQANRQLGQSVMLQKPYRPNLNNKNAFMA